MHIVQDLYFHHPLWVWLGVAAILLAIELPTGTGWLLWPSACAAIVGLLTAFGLNWGWAREVALYAGLTIVATLVSRRFLPRPAPRGPDINDRAEALVGKTGQAVAHFTAGAGRVLVDGAEWEAELDQGKTLEAGDRVEVVRVLGGARVAVRPI